MKFDIDVRLEHAYNGLKSGLDMEEELKLREEIGSKAFDMLNNIVSYTRGKKFNYNKIDLAELQDIKHEYLIHKEKKEYVIGAYGEPFTAWDSVADAQKYVSEQVTKGKMFNSYDVDNDLLAELCKFTTKEFTDANGKVVKVKGSPYDEMRNEIKKIIQQYIKHGYNPYNIMNSLLKQAKEYTELNKHEVNKEDANVRKAAIAQCYDICVVLENCEKTFSPYQRVFETAERLGRLINQSRKLNKEGKIEESVELDEKIDSYRDEIAEALLKCKCDLKELEHVLVGKTKYTRDSEVGFNHQSVNYDLYQGLIDMKKIVNFQARKLLDNGLSA